MSPTQRPRIDSAVLFGFGALSLIFAAGCNVGVDGPFRSDEPSGLRPVEAVRVIAAPLERREMVQRLTTTALVESEVEVSVMPRASGEAVELLAEEGDEVEAGAVLARLDEREERLALREAEVQLEEAGQAAERAAVALGETAARLRAAERSYEQSLRDYARDEELAAGGDGRFASVSARALEASRLARDQAESEVEQARLARQRAELEQVAAETAVGRARVQLDRAELALVHRAVRAPFTGRVAQRHLRLGEQASPTQAAFVLTDLERLRVVFHRPQRELGLFLAGGASSPAELELFAGAEAWPGLRFPGRIERVSPTLDAASGTFRVTARLEPRPEAAAAGSPRLLPGMLVRLTLITDRRGNSLVAPKRAIQREGEATHLFVVRGDVARRVPVVEGYSDDTHVEVRPEEGFELEDGDQVVTVGSRDLEDGSAVRLESAR